MRKTKNRYFILILPILAIFLLLSGFLCLTQKNYKVIYATEGTPYITTEITNNGAIFTSQLWKALKRFYIDISEGNEELEGRIHKNAEGYDYFYPDLFKDFPNITLDLSSKEIDSIENLEIMDLSSFTKIDLSNNQITSVTDEFINIENLQELDLSNNQITSFSYSSLHQTAYSQNLVNLDISNNKITTCDISKINQGQIDAKLNYIDNDGLKLPENSDVIVNITHNLLNQPDTTNANITYGFQGAKNNGSYIVGKSIYFYGLTEIEEIKIYKLIPVLPEQDSQNTEITYTEIEIDTLIANQSFTFEYGYYRLKFSETESDNPLFQTMTFYIAPNAPTIKMFVNGQELEKITHRTTVPITIKLYGDENATFIVNNSILEGNELIINKNGIYTLTFYQLFDNMYKSAPYVLYLEYSAPQTMSWVYAIGGAAIVLVLLYLAIIYSPKLTNINLSKKNNDKTNLD